LVQVTQQLAMVWSLPLSHESICAPFASIPTELHFVRLHFVMRVFTCAYYNGIGWHSSAVADGSWGGRLEWQPA
jgi:hypothetical protein